MNLHILHRTCLLTVGAMLAAGTAAGENRPTLALDLSAGYQYDSNVSIQEIDTSTGEADGALLLGAGIAAGLPLTERWSLTLRYDLSSIAYRRFSEFDTAIHHGQAELGYRFPWLDTAVTVDRFQVRLDDEAFMGVEQVAPSIARQFGESLYLRGSYTVARKSNETSPGRNADNDSFRVDAYLLFDGLDHYLAVSYRVDQEDARDGELDYDGYRTGLVYGKRFPFGNRHLTLKSRLQLEQRDYVNETESIGAARNDRRLRAGIAAVIDLSEYFELEADAGYADNRSNLPAAAFDEVVYSVNVGASF